MARPSTRRPSRSCTPSPCPSSPSGGWWAPSWSAFWSPDLEGEPRHAATPLSVRRGFSVWGLPFFGFRAKSLIGLRSMQSVVFLALMYTCFAIPSVAFAETVQMLLLGWLFSSDESTRLKFFAMWSLLALETVLPSRAISALGYGFALSCMWLWIRLSADACNVM